MFQVAWVCGALIPVLPFWPTTLGLASAGVIALVIQVGYVSLVLVPESVRGAAPDVGGWPEGSDDGSDSGVLDLI